MVLVLDLMCLFMVLAIDAELGSAQKDDEQDEFVLTLQQIRVGLKSFHTFARYFSLVEIVTLIITFNTRVLGHVGYTLDAVIIGLQVRQAFSGGGLDGGGLGGGFDFAVGGGGDGLTIGGFPGGGGELATASGWQHTEQPPKHSNDVLAVS